MAAISGSTTSTIDTQSSFAATDNPYNYYRWWNTVKDASVSGGCGGSGHNIRSATSGATTPYPFEHHGGPGEGIDGYGIGGFGFFSSASGAAYRTLNPLGSKQYPINRENTYNSSADTAAYYNNGLDNSGNGANGSKIQASNGTNLNGNRGGSGIVIVRWYE